MLLISFFTLITPLHNCCSFNRDFVFLDIPVSLVVNKHHEKSVFNGVCLPLLRTCAETHLRSSLVAEANVVELFREDPEEELGLRIVGGKDTPLGNIVIQEIVRDSVAARSGKLSPGDHVLEVRSHAAWNAFVFASTESKHRHKDGFSVVKYLEHSFLSSQTHSHT